MRLIYIVNAKMPTVKGYDVHVAKMCEAFGKEGVDVELIVPRRAGKREDPYAYYNVERTFCIRRIFCIDLLQYFYWLGYWIQALSFVMSAAALFSFGSRRGVVIYTREYMIAPLFRMLGYATVYEAHRIPAKKRAFFALLRGIRKIVTNSEGVAAEFRARGFSDVLALPNGVTLSEFDNIGSKEDVRAALGLPRARIVMYLGHLYAWKGAETILRVAEEIRSDDDIRIVCVGGIKEDVERYRNEAGRRGLSNILFVGHVPKRETPRYLRAADVLLLPNSPVTEESVRYTSPIKLFEYMASERPIIASDLPSIREILHEENAVLVAPDDAPAFAAAIRRLLSDQGAAESLSKRARADVGQYTWQRRAERALAFVRAS